MVALLLLGKCRKEAFPSSHSVCMEETIFMRHFTSIDNTIVLEILMVYECQQEREKNYFQFYKIILRIVKMETRSSKCKGVNDFK